MDAEREACHAPCARCDQTEEAGCRAREIARRVGAAPSTVRETLKRVEAAGLGWPLPVDMTDAALEARLFANAGTKQGHRRQEEPDWADIHRALKRKHVTLSIVWEEYIAAHPGGYRYSRFCELYRAFEDRLPVTMRQNHAAGEKLFVDYAGDGVAVVIDRLTGEIRNAQIFVAVLGASSFTFARATWTQSAGGFCRRPCPCTSGDRRGASIAGTGQHQGRGDQGLPLRSADQPHLCRHGSALRHGDSSGEAAGARATRRRSSRRCSWSSAGFSGGCATAPSTASPRSMRRSASCCSS